MQHRIQRGETPTEFQFQSHRNAEGWLDIGWISSGESSIRRSLACPASFTDDDLSYVRQMFTRSVEEWMRMRAAGNRPPPRKRTKLSQVQ